jgi:anti-sigma factor RsiW
MNKHLSEGDLRAALDGELAGDELEHLNRCATCQARKERIRLQIQPAVEGLSFLAATTQAPAPGEQRALRNFYQRNTTRKEKSMFKRLFASPVVKIGLAIVLILAIVLSIPATRALADQLLSLFRVQQVVVVPVDFTGIQQLTGNNAIGSQISQLISSSVTVEQKPAEPVSATDAAQASQMAGFNVRLPGGMNPSSINVEKAAAFSFKVDRAKAQALLNEAGRSDLVLPASIDGADVSVKIPASVSAGYGNCPTVGTEDNGLGLNSGSAGRRYADCILMAEIPSPTVSAPADVNIPQLAQIALEFTGMSADQAATFTSTVDWTSSLVVPIPKNAATYEQVTVDGVTGTLIQRPADDAPQYVLLWVKNGIIYAISSLGADSSKAIQMANSLP